MSRAAAALAPALLKRRRTKIIATIGPASADQRTVKQLVDAGVDIFRLNMSHGDHESHRAAYETIRAATSSPAAVGILADLSGPKMRVGRFEGGSVELIPGSSVTMTTRDVLGRPGIIPSQYDGLARDARPGCRVFLDDGFLELRVESVQRTEVGCTVVQGGRLSDRKGINLPDVEMSAPALTDKDRVDAQFASELGVDWFALSFVRRAEDVDELRSLLPAPRDLGIIAKVEHPEAIDNLDSLLASADGIMVARGDLGVELPPERLPVVQRDLVGRARATTKTAIVATQMLESMCQNPRPTRAEVSDVSTAVFSGADAVMLSAETATGRHPVRAVAMMDRIAREVEAHLWTERGFFFESKDDLPLLPVYDAVARSTAQLSRDLQVRAIVALSTSGKTARVISSARPAAPIVAVTPSEGVFRRMTMLWGTVPQLASEDEIRDPHPLARRLVRQLGLAQPSQPILFVSGFADSLEGSAPTITILAA